MVKMKKKLEWIKRIYEVYFIILVTGMLNLLSVGDFGFGELFAITMMALAVYYMEKV